eukprot:m.307073 g.307073  ORF g.307073 m.307073 type:complete len:215 (+) comp41870_c0_seq1:79-723(+)
MKTALATTLAFIVLVQTDATSTDDFCVPGFQPCCGTADGKYEEQCKGQESASCSKCCSGKTIPLIDRRVNPPKSRCCVRDGVRCCSGKIGSCYAKYPETPLCSYCCNTKVRNFPCSRDQPPTCYCGSNPPAAIGTPFYDTRKLANVYLTSVGKSKEENRPKIEKEIDEIKAVKDCSCTCLSQKDRKWRDIYREVTRNRDISISSEKVLCVCPAN